MKEEDNIQDWNNFIKEVKIVFSDKSKITDTKWKIKIFKQDITNKILTGCDTGAEQCFRGSV